MAEPAFNQNNQSENRPVKVRMKKATAVAKAGGTAGQVAGTGVQATGKVVGAAGSGVTRAGAALSGTGIGAVAGVPLMAAGGVMKATGKGAEATGKGIRKASTGIKRGAKVTERSMRTANTSGKPRILPTPTSVNQRFRRTMPGMTRIGKRRKVAKKGGVNFIHRRIIQTAIWQFATWIWLWQLLFFTLFVLFFSIYGQMEGSWAARATTWALSWVNDDVDTIRNMGIGFVLLPWAMASLFTEFFLFTTAFVLKTAGVGVANTSGKTGLLLLAFIGYALPILNIFPWALLWLFALYKNPK